MEAYRCKRRAATDISKQRNPQGYNAQTQVAKEGGSVAKAARKQLESKLGRSVISKSMNTRRSYAVLRFLFNLDAKVIRTIKTTCSCKFPYDN